MTIPLLDPINRAIERIFMAHHPFSAICFDCDGVIIDSMPTHVAAWVDAFANHGCTIDPLDIYIREGSTTVDVSRDVWQRHMGRPIDPDVQKQLIHDKETAYRERFQLSFFPEIPAILDICESHNIRVAMVTGTSSGNLTKSVPAEMLDRFDAIVTAESIANGKPAPDPYLKGAELLHLSPNNCLAVENAPYGIASAKGAGMTCVAIATSLAAEHVSEADRIFANHADFMAWLKATV